MISRACGNPGILWGSGFAAWPCLCANMAHALIEVQILGFVPFLEVIRMLLSI